MQPRRLVGVLVLAVACFLCGLLLSDRLLGPAVSADRRDAVAGDAVAGDESAARAENDSTSEPVRDASRSRAGRGEIQRLRAELARRDETIADLRGERADGAADPDDSDIEMGDEERRWQRWERIQNTFARVLPAMIAMEDEGTDALPLGPLLLDRLRKITAEEFAELVAFDAEETDPEIYEPIRAVMLQALVHAPAAAPLRDTYMSRVLERVKTGAYNDLFIEEALHRLSVASGKSIDRHRSLIEPLDRDVRGRFIALAEHRLENGPTEPLQIDGARFLSRSTDPRATLALMRAFERTDQDAWIRLAALDGLASRAATDTEVRGFLRDSRSGERQHEVRAKLDEVLERLNAR